MTWMTDSKTLGAFDDLMMSMGKPLDHFLTEIHKHAEQSPPWMILFAYGKFVMEYDTLRNLGHDILAAYNGALAVVVSDPGIQALLAQFTQQAINKGLFGGEF